MQRPHVLARFALAVAALLAAPLAQAADKVKVGFVSTLSGPSSALGVDIRDGFLLAVKLNGGKLGGLPAEVLVSDDQFKPDVAKQLFEKNIKRDKVDFMTGVVFSNIMLAALPEALRQQRRSTSARTPRRRRSPARTATRSSSPCRGRTTPTTRRRASSPTTRGLKSVYLIAPNYQAGKDSLAGFKRTFKGQIVGEIYTKLGQLDYAAELAEIRAAKPQARLHLPARRHGHQLHQAVRRRRPRQGHDAAAAGLLGRPGRDQPGRRADGRASSTPRTGRPTSTTPPTRSSSPSSRRNTSACRRSTPSQGYDAALLIDAAVRDVKGKLEDQEAVRKALKAAQLRLGARRRSSSTRNQYPIQNYYVRTVGSDGKGGLINKSFNEPILKDHGDAYVQRLQDEVSGRRIARPCPASSSSSRR